MTNEEVLGAGTPAQRRFSRWSGSNPQAEGGEKNRFWRGLRIALAGIRLRLLGGSVDGQGNDEHMHHRR